MNSVAQEDTLRAMDRLRERLGTEWSHLAAARDLSLVTQQRLRTLLRDQDPSDTSIVVFGSLARGEFTAGSDVDWTLLIDGQADESHYTQAQTIAKMLAKEGFHEPGPTGVFGHVAFSHPILHQIGGQEDTNKNTTQRILLLLESLAVGKEDAHERVLRLILARYVEDDRGLLYGAKSHTIPRFLLNDIVRYWRTMAVDFVNKQRERTGGWALRNAKLRISRKLIFVSGLLTCFSFELFGRGEKWTDDHDKVSTPLLCRFLRNRIKIAPLENLAEALLRPSISAKTTKLLLDSYNDFLGILADDDKRQHLKNLPLEALGGDAVFREVRHLGHQFQQGLNSLFFEEDEEISQLMRLYGVF